MKARPLKQPGANERVNVAAVGSGGQGRSNINNVAKIANANLVAFCDVDDNNASQTYQAFPNVQQHTPISA